MKLRQTDGVTVQSTRRIAVVAAVIEDGGLVLACRRMATKPAGGKWEFPGGKVEPGETPRAALVREIQEELAVEIVGLNELQTDVTRVGGTLIQLTCFAAQLAETRPQRSSDHDLLQWMEPRELLSLDWAEPDLPVVRRLASKR